jgi:hypothetical protein
MLILNDVVVNITLTINSWYMNLTFNYDYGEYKSFNNVINVPAAEILSQCIDIYWYDTALEWN